MYVLARHIKPLVLWLRYSQSNKRIPPLRTYKTSKMDPIPNTFEDIGVSYFTLFSKIWQKRFLLTKMI